MVRDASSKRDVAAAVPDASSRRSRWLRLTERHLCGGVSSTSADPPLGSLEGARPPLRCCSVSDLGTTAAGDVMPLHAWPAPLPDDHPAVLQFKRLGYVVITDAVTLEPLQRATKVFRSKQHAAKQIREVGRHLQQTRLGHSPDEPSEQYYDLPREDIGIVPEAFNTGAHGGFLVTQDVVDFSAYMEILANPQVLPLLLALVGPALHLEEVGARTVEAPPLEQALKYGGYTEWHRDAGGRSADAVAKSPSSTGLLPHRLPIGTVGCDYNRVKCFVMLTDVDATGGSALTRMFFRLSKRRAFVTLSCAGLGLCVAHLGWSQARICGGARHQMSSKARQWEKCQAMSKLLSRPVAWRCSINDAGYGHIEQSCPQPV